MKWRISIPFTLMALCACVLGVAGIAPAQDDDAPPPAAPAPAESPADAEGDKPAQPTGPAEEPAGEAPQEPSQEQPARQPGAEPGEEPAEKPEGEKPEGEKPESDKPATEKPADKPDSEKPAKKPTSEKPADKPTSEKPADKPDSEKPAEKPASEKPAEKPEGEKPESDKPATEKPADKPANKPESDKPATEKPAEKPDGEKPADKPASEKPADKPESEKPAADKPASEKPADKPESEKPAADSPEPSAGERFAAAWSQWKALLDDMRALRAQYRLAAPADQPALREQWNSLVARGQELMQRMRDAGTEAFAAAPNEDEDLAKFLVSVLKDDTQRDEYDRAMRLAQVLIDNGCLVDEVYNWAGVAAFATHQFDKAEQYLGQAANRGALQPETTSYLDEAGRYQELWEQEQQLRAREAEADDLPRVRLTTSQGEIVLELFENEAPDTVGNFVHLVETGYYDGLTFHRVIGGFMAQGGCPEGTGTGGPGYEIYCECEKENHRKHFRGSLSMAHSGKDTGGSQFFLTFRPTPNLNGRHTVFGRVIEGMDVLAKLQRRDPSSTGPLPEPDKIVKAEVLRKREHDYKPNKVQ